MCVRAYVHILESQAGSAPIEMAKTERVPRGPLHMPVSFRLGPECGCPGMCSNFRLTGSSRQVWREVEHVMVL